jgi:hypothetical protein
MGINPPGLTSIAGQMQINADGSGRYTDSAHFGQSVVWDPLVDGDLGLLSSDGYAMWKKTSGGNYKAFVTFVLGYPTVQKGVGVLPTKGFVRYTALGTFALSNDCSTLTFKGCNMVFPASDDTINPNDLSCDGLNEGTLVFRKIPTL